MSRVFFCTLSLVLIIADQLSKWLIAQLLMKPVGVAAYDIPDHFSAWFFFTQKFSSPVVIEVLPVLNLVLVWNPGVSFGMFSQSGDYGPIFLIILSLLISFGFFIWMLRTMDRWLMFGISLVIGGALGNVFDRARFGAVIDFVDFHIGDWHYPAFNLADSCIVVGVFFLMIYTLFFEKRLHHLSESVYDQELLQVDEDS